MRVEAKSVFCVAVIAATVAGGGCRRNAPEARNEEPTIPEEQPASAEWQNPDADLPDEERFESGRETRRQLFLSDADEAIKNPAPVPEWLRDALWYYIDVPRFRNGETSNDSPDVPPWGEKRTGTKLPPEASIYGGDLQGLREKLPYLKELGVNALILDGVFPENAPLKKRSDLLGTLHVRDSVAIRDSRSAVSGETLDPSSWKLTPSDELFLSVLGEAQAQGFHVVVEYPHPAASGHLEPHLYFYDYSPFAWEMNQRWLRKSNESKGIDGWSCGDTYSEVTVFAGWRKHIKEANADCVLVGLDLTILSDEPLRSGIHADALLYISPSESVVSFFQIDPRDSVAAFQERLPTSRQRWPECLRLKLGLSRELHLVNCLGFEPGEKGRLAPVDASKLLTPELIDRWRLATVFQLLHSNEYVIPFGEEVGLTAEGPPFLPEPMWWSDLPNPESKRTAYRGDFYALVRTLNALRGRYPALRRGEYKAVLADDEKKLLAYSRSLPDEELIVVMNIGGAKQRVELTVGTPGQLITVLTPQLKPMPLLRKGGVVPPDPDLTKIPDLRLGAGRQYVKPDGRIDFWVDPMAVRVVINSTNEPK